MPRILALATLLGLLAVNAPALAQTTNPTGSGAPFTNLQPYAALNYIICTEGDPGLVGQVMPFASFFVPTGWAAADGQLLDPTVNTDLFNVIGNTYGGDGSTTFALPDLRGRTAIGAGTGSGLSSYTLGQAVGTETSTLAEAQMPAHTHSFPSGTTGSTGGAAPVSNMQPSLALNYILGVTGEVGSGTQSPFLGEIALWAGPTAPAGWALANGQSSDPSVEPQLFNITDTAFGGDGVNSFLYPDLQGRTAIGVGQGSGLPNYTRGQADGLENLSLSLGNLAAHSHTLQPSGSTGVTGSSNPFSSNQPELALHYIIATEGIFPNNGGIGGAPNGTMLSEVRLFAGDVAPDGWMFAEGQALFINQNQALFALLGTTYGGDGQFTFALPDLRGRTVIGTGQGPDLAQYFSGDAGGDASYLLDESNLPEHVHSVPEPSTIALALVGAVAVAGIARRRLRR